MTNQFSMSLIFSAATLIVAAPCVFGANGALYVFCGTAAGASPSAPLTSDQRGNLYGTTQLGGPADQGTVFELSPNASGGYTFTQLYAFQSGIGDAQIPDTGALLLDPAGNLFGTTPTGGAFGGGAVYEVSPQPGGGWIEKVIFSFPQDSSVWFPNGGLIMDASGSIYGTADHGGAYNGGGVFRLSPNGSGGWTGSVIADFTNARHAPVGSDPAGALAFDSAGNLYGANFVGGAHSDGTIFQLTPGPGGTWTEHLVHTFSGNDGCSPHGNLIVDAAGNVYGTTYTDGPYTENCVGSGTVFKLSPTSAGWEETVLHSFPDGTHDGIMPNGIVLDQEGNIYGTTNGGGEYFSGTIYKLTPTARGPWTQTVIYSFVPGLGGAFPEAGVIFGIDGYLYGTTSSYGSTNGQSSGTVYQIHP